MNTPRMISLHAVSVGLPAWLGDNARGEQVMSGIRKTRVTTKTIAVDRLNLAGDRQADLRAHGGVDKAIYVYPSEHLPVWTSELAYERPLGPNDFGENLTIGGIVETDACIGDIWKWGTVVVQISQPRGPCYKLEWRLNLPGLVPVFTASGRTGWYLRVLEPGIAPVEGPIELVERHPVGLTVWEANHARMIGDNPALIEKALRVPELAHAWSKSLKVPV